MPCTDPEAQKENSYHTASALRISRETSHVAHADPVGGGDLGNVVQLS